MMNRARCQDVKWYSAKSVEIEEGIFAMQPLDSLCEKCGKVIYMHLNEDPQDVIKRAHTDRIFRARIMLYHAILSGDLPQGFIAKRVKTLNSIGTRNHIEVAAVRKADFMSHFQMKAWTFESKKIEDRLMTWIDGEGNETEGVAIDIRSEVPENLPYEIIEVFFQKHTEIEELHLDFGDNITETHAKDLFHWQVDQAAKARPANLRVAHLFKAKSFSAWTKAVNEEDDKRKQRDAELQSLGRQLGSTSAAPTLEVRGGPAAASDVGRSSNKSRGAARPAAGSRGGSSAAARGGGQSGRVKAQPAASRSRSRSPARRPSRPNVKNEPGSARTPMVKAEPGTRRTPSSGDIEVSLDRDDSPARGGGGKVGRAFQRKELNVQECLDASNGGNEGRSTRPDHALAHFEGIGHRC